MKFQDKFKPGDIICSDRFHNGLCMVVESSSYAYAYGQFMYRCQDFVRDGQKWAACEFCGYNSKLYNWRIATDDDIANYLSRFLHIPLGKVGAYEARLTDNGIRLDDDSDYSIFLDAGELVQLNRIINKRVVG